jgi:hypothetical protein
LRLAAPVLLLVQNHARHLVPSVHLAPLVLDCSLVLSNRLHVLQRLVAVVSGRNSLRELVAHSPLTEHRVRIY